MNNNRLNDFKKYYEKLDNKNLNYLDDIFVLLSYFKNWFILNNEFKSALERLIQFVNYIENTEVNKGTTAKRIGIWKTEEFKNTIFELNNYIIKRNQKNGNPTIFVIEEYSYSLGTLTTVINLIVSQPDKFILKVSTDDFEHYSYRSESIDSLIRFIFPDLNLNEIKNLAKLDRDSLKLFLECN